MQPTQCSFQQPHTSCDRRSVVRTGLALDQELIDDLHRLALPRQQEDLELTFIRPRKLAHNMDSQSPFMLQVLKLTLMNAPI